MPGEFAETIQVLQQALRMMMQTLDVLDGGGAPPQIAAHLEMAISETKRLLAPE